MPSFSRLIPKLRVNVDRAGRLSPYHPAKHTDPDWWASVLSDQRAQASRKDWQDRLREHRGERLTLKCEKCPRCTVRNVDELIAKYGADCPCSAAVFAILDEGGGCRFKHCRMTYETTKQVQPPAW
jgi:hypothetical protein